MEPKVISPTQINIKSPKGRTFIYNPEEDHSAVIHALVHTPEGFKQFTEAMDTLGNEEAYYQFSGVERPPSPPTEAEVMDAKAKEYASLMAEGKFEEAYYLQQGAKKPDEKPPKK